MSRCGWCLNDSIYIQYHDLEWGKPLYDEQSLFELLCLEGQQAGLSWLTVLKKRECYRHHFFQFSIHEIAQFSDHFLTEKLQDQGLIRHPKKIYSIRDNAIAWQALKSEVGDVPIWLWSFVQQKTIIHHIDNYKTLPSSTIISQAMSKALKKYRFKFVGPTICYAFMQASGMVNDHENDCMFK